MRDFGDKFFPALFMPNKIKLIASCATELINRPTSEFRLYKRYVKYLSKL